MVIKRHFDHEMADLRELVRSTGDKVLRMFEYSQERSGNFDQALFDRIYAIEVEVNRSQMRIDDLTWKIMALFQPTASDLRILIGGIKLASNLERIGDEIIVWNRRGVDVSKNQWRKQPPQLYGMEAMVKSILKDGLTVISNLDMELAESIFESDDIIDHEFKSLFEAIREEIKVEPSHVDSLLDYMSMGRSLERIGDYATNLAEIAIFMKKGQDVRHHNLEF